MTRKSCFPVCIEIAIDTVFANLIILLAQQLEDRQVHFNDTGTSLVS